MNRTITAARARQTSPSTSKEGPFPKKTHRGEGTVAKISEDMGTAPILRSAQEAGELVKENYKLVFWGIKRYGLYTIPGVERDDVEQVVAMSLFNTCLRWDPSKYALSTYAGARMRQCRNILEKDAGIVSFNSHLIISIRHYGKWRSLNPNKSLENFAEYEGVSLERAEEIVVAARRRSGSLKPKKGSVGWHYIGWYSRFRTSRPDKRIERKSLADDVEKTLKRLKPQERLAVSSYYLGGKTQEAIGKELGVSANRIGFVLQKALRKLKCTAHNRLLRPHLQAYQVD